MPHQRDPSPEVTPASLARQPLTQRRRQFTQWFATVALGIMCFFGPYSYLQGRTQTSAVIAICGLLLLGMRIWIGRRPQSVLPPLLLTVACQVALMVGMWNSGGVESASIVWIPLSFLLAALLLEARQAIVLFVLCIVGMMGMVHFSDAAPVVERTGLDSIVDVVGAMAGTAFLSLVFIRSQRLAERRLERIVQRLEAEVEARTRAEHEALGAARAKSRFLATVSHELRTPLNGVLGMSELLGRTDMTPEQRGMLETVQRSGDLLVRVINDTLTFSAVEAGGAELMIRPMSLQNMVADVVASLQATAPASVEVVSTIADDADDGVLGDADRLRQVMLNLGTNAVKFSGQGQVRLELRRDGDRQLLVVDDSGPGIAADDLERIFDAFVQLDDTAGRRHGGTGLGLSIVHGLVKAMGGDIQVRSEMGVGTRFEVRLSLPLADVEMRDASSELSSDGRVEDCRVLVVEDNPVNAYVVGALLDSLGVSWHHADGGEAALQALDSAAWSVVLMDLQMPGMDGLEATRRIRATGFGAPIVALTADAMPEDAARCLAAGMQAHLGKPVRRAQLEKMLHRWAGVRVST